ncbi:hypothetical protein COR50_07095 [Chitinophaga caeni]|uniref:Uncharacterized protein n=1 Tax=Chitinophaga caeni TaxID=2029983 RepID=A0A291QSM7_9BACT|nr:DUF5689 domain-containing protein [Chitinophaga caeni]ATL46968.1 hypothetical protein COR50_07095 [Chitinophaga caeni]
MPHFIFRKLSWFFLVAGFSILCLYACRKEEDVKFVTDLAIDSRIVRMPANADTTRIIIYSEGNWNLEVTEPVEWLHLMESSGNGKGEALISLQDNNGNLPRSVKVLVKGNGKTDSIDIQQKGLTPTIKITDETAQSIANGGILKTPINTNVPLELMDITYRYDSTGGTWVSGLQLQDGYLYFKVDSNKLTTPRSVMLYLGYLDALGAITKDSLKISQNLGMSYEGAVVKDFQYVKQMLATGKIEENIFIEGIVISDKGHPNIAKNWNNTSNKHTLDKTGNEKAVYVQDLDGTEGIYIQTATPGQNIFNFNDKVRIWLKDADLERFNDPNYVIVSGIEVKHIMQKEARMVNLEPREKYIGDLTDNDLYTYIKLKDVEISVPSGSFTNINEGYAARTDCYPTHVRDIQGSGLYMLTNLGVPYRRDGNQVPQGSGSIAGILVHETMDRYGGDIGRYAIRHLSREGIDLKEDRSQGFSNVLVEWSRFKKEFAAAPTASENPLTPDIGQGKLYKTGNIDMDFTGTGIYGTTDYNGLIPEATTVKGSIANGAWGSKNWWSTANNSGEAWMIEVSSSGISTPISLQIEGNSDIGGPRNFIAEWSDGSGNWNSIGTYTLQDVTNWSNTLLTQVPGHKVLNFNLPVAASGLEKLVIRLRVLNKICGSTTNPNGGTLGANGVTRLAHVSLKYNK